MGLFDLIKKKVKKLPDSSLDKEKQTNIQNNNRTQGDIKKQEEDNAKDILELSKKSSTELNELYDELCDKYMKGSELSPSTIDKEMKKIFTASLVKRGIKQYEATKLLEGNEYFYFNPFKWRCDDPRFDFIESFNKYNGTIMPILDNSGCYSLLLKLFSENKLDRQQLAFRCKSIEAPQILLNKNLWDDSEYYKNNFFSWIIQWWLWSSNIKDDLDLVDNKVLLLVLFGDHFFDDNEFLFENPKFVNPSRKHEIIKHLIENVLTTENIANSDEREYEYIVSQIRRYIFYTKWGEFYDEMEPIINFMYIYYDYDKYSYLDYSVSKDDIEDLINDKLILLKNKRLDFINYLIEEDQRGFHLNKSELQPNSVITFNSKCMAGDNLRKY